MEIKAKHVILLGAFIVLTLLGYIFLPRDEILIQTSSKEVNEATSSNFTSTPDLEKEAKNDEIIYVHIEGAVNFPGIKEVEKGTRLFELIEVAGGATIDADTSKINLASILKDEQKIYIPFIVIEEVSEENGVQSNINKSTLNNNLYQASNMVNINNASVDELQTLEGIGPSMAQKIVTYREEVGYFNSIEEIQNVSGIGEAKFNKIKENITI